MFSRLFTRPRPSSPGPESVLPHASASPSAPLSRPLRVVLYEPHGSGGICHYTYQLAQSLTHVGLDVIVCTRATYELLHLPRSFRLLFPFEHSRVLTRLRRLFRLTPPPPAPDRASGESPDAPASFPPRARARFLRRAVLWLEALLAIRALRPDVVHFQWALHPVEEYIAIRLLQCLRFPVVYTAHNILPHDICSPRDRRMFARIYGAVDRIIVHADRNKGQLLSEFIVDPDNIAVIPHGRYDLFQRQRPAKADARAHLALPADAKIVLFFGTVRRYKGLEYLVSGLNHVVASVPNALLLVVGEIHHSHVHDPQYYDELVQRLRDHANIKWVRDYVPVDAVEYYFAACDVVALPYVNVYQSGVLLLAYGSGKPVVATDTGGLGELEHGANGLVVPPRNADALAQAIVSLLGDASALRAMGARSQYLADTKYAWPNIARTTSEVYQACRIPSVSASNTRPSNRTPHPAGSRPPPV